MSESCRMDPADVPDELIAAAERAADLVWADYVASGEMWDLSAEGEPNVDVGVDHWRAILAAVLPEFERQVREKVAESIDAELADPNSDYERGLDVASAIARGEA
jgi:hypothetical protein